MGVWVCSVFVNYGKPYFDNYLFEVEGVEYVRKFKKSLVGSELPDSVSYDVLTEVVNPVVFVSGEYVHGTKYMGRVDLLDVLSHPEKYFPGFHKVYLSSGVSYLPDDVNKFIDLVFNGVKRHMRYLYKVCPMSFASKWSALMREWPRSSRAEVLYLDLVEEIIRRTFSKVYSDGSCEIYERDGVIGFISKGFSLFRDVYIYSSDFIIVLYRLACDASITFFPSAWEVILWGY